MKFTVCLLVAMWCWRALAQQEEPELMRLTRRNSHEGSSSYKTSVVHSEPQGRKQSISSVTVQLQLKDKQTPLPNRDNEYEDSPPSEDSKHPSKRTQEQKNEKQSDSPKPNSFSFDSDTGASNNHASASYVLPPDSFMNQMRQNQLRYIGNQGQIVQQFAGTQPPQLTLVSTPSPPIQSSYNNQPQQYNYIPSGSSNNVHYVSTPAPYLSTQAPRIHLFSSPSNYPQHSASQQQYVSTPAPNAQYGSNSQSHSNFGSQSQSSENNVQYASTPAPRLQYMSTPSPAMQFMSHISPQHSNSQMQFVSTSSPNEQYVSTSAPQNNYVSSSNQYVSTPSPAQFSTSSPLYGTRLSSLLGQSGSNENVDKQMQIDHFDNGMSGIRNPKYNPQSSAGMYISSTPAPQSSNSNSNSHVSQNPNEYIWRSTIVPNDVLISHMHNQQQSKTNQQQLQSNNYQSQSNQNSQNGQYHLNSNQNNNQQEQLNQNSVESANNLVVNVVHPQQQYRGQRQQQISKTTHQRDIDKETEVAPMYSNGEYGWKLSPKKGGSQLNSINDNLQQNSGLYSISSIPTGPSNYGSQVLSLQSSSSGSGIEYRPYPENPFLNKISYQSTTSPVKTSSVQSINFQPDNNQQQNVNVGYSIGFGNHGNLNHDSSKLEPTVYANKYPFGGDSQEFTSASSIQNNLQSDIIRGVHLSHVSIPQQTYVFKDTPNPQDYVTNALKVHEKLKLTQSPQYAENFGSNYVTSVPYKQTQNFNSDSGNGGSNNVNTHIFSGSQKVQTYSLNPSNIVTSYHGAEVRNNDGRGQTYKWTNVGPGVEVASGSQVHSVKSLNDGPERVTPSPLIYISNPNKDVVTNTPFFFTTQKGLNEVRTVQNFDHANALKNIQPIGLSNVVSYSPSPSGDTISTVTISPHYINGANQQQQYSPQLSSIPNGHFIQNFPQDLINVSPNNGNSPNIFEQNLNNFYNNYKPLDQSFYKDKNVIYNIQSFKSNKNGFDSNESNDIRLNSNLFGHPREQNAFESTINFHSARPSEVVSPSTFLVTSPSDMLGHSSNLETRQVSHMEYVPSETFRQGQSSRESGNSYHQNGQGSSSQMNMIQSNGDSSSNYHTTITHPPPPGEFQNRLQLSDNQNYDSVYKNDIFNGRMNQHMRNHRLEPAQANSDNSYQYVNSNNQRKKNDDVMTYDRQNEIDPNTGETLTTIHGIKVANPYNVDLKVVSDILRGKPAIDESRLEPMREQMSRLSPLKLDTSSLQHGTSKSEHITLQIDIPDRDMPEGSKNQEYFNYDPLGPSRSNMREDIEEFESDFKQNKFKSKSEEEMYQNDFKEDPNEPNQHNIPNVASEQLQSSLQGVINSHQIGAVIDQEPGFKQRARNQETPSGLEDFSRFMSFENSGTGFSENSHAREQRVSSNAHHPNALVSEDVPQKQTKTSFGEPYPLLKPPRPPTMARAVIHKKSEKRTFTPRHHRVFGARQNRPSKMMTFREPEEIEDYEDSYSIQTELRPPPVNMKKKSG